MQLRWSFYLTLLACTQGREGREEAALGEHQSALQVGRYLGRYFA